MGNEQVSIIIPSMDNIQYLRPCLLSLIETRQGDTTAHIYVVNNGHPNSCDWIDPQHKMITVLQTGGKNLGWEGALQLGLESTKAPFVVFLNDDTIFPYSSKGWLNVMLRHFYDPKVAAVGPTSNMVMGLQNMLAQTDLNVFTTTFLIGFCMLVRRSALEEVGGVDQTLPGGDDLDLSIRFRKAGYKILVDKHVFVFHYGSQTGNKLYGDHRIDGGWNSPTFTEKTNLALIKKHGFRWWWETIKGASQPPSCEYNFKKDTEGDLIRKKIGSVKGLKVIDVGCGNLKTFKGSIGIDIVPKGEIVEQIGGNSPSQADIVADVSQPLPLEEESVDLLVSRHVLEHMMDPIQVFQNWLKVVKKGGRIVLSVPNEHLIASIPMNPEHVHAWTPENMQTFLKTIGGTKILDMWDGENGISFTTLLEKL